MGRHQHKSALAGWLLSGEERGDPAVFVGRDDTLIHNDGDLADPDQVRLIQGAASAVASLRGLGYKIVVVTNQAGVARGSFTEADVHATHRRIAELVHELAGATIDRFYYCPYHREGRVRRYARDHPWRKPNPGMLLQAAEELDLDLAQCWMVGDQARDIEAGRAAGTRTLLIRPSGEVKPGLTPDLTAASLTEAARMIAQHPHGPEPTGAGEGRARAAEAVHEGAARRLSPPDAPAAAPAVDRGFSDVGTPPWGGRSASPTTGADPDEATRARNRARDGLPHAADACRDTTSSVEADVSRRGEEIASACVAETGRATDGRRSETPTATTGASPPEASEGEPRAGATPDGPSTGRSGATEPASEEARPTGSRDERPTDREIHGLLNQILRELKAQRVSEGDFSYASLLALVGQMLVGACALFGLMYYDRPVLFGQWFAGAILLQLVVITLLQMNRPR